MLCLRYAGEKNCWTDGYTIPTAREKEKSWAVSETSQIENVRFTFAGDRGNISHTHTHTDLTNIDILYYGQ